MATQGRDPKNMVPLLESYKNIEEILYVLADIQPRHGYAINKALPNELGPATLYRTLHRMAEEGLIEEVEAPPDEVSPDQRRRYYRLTPFGQGAGQAYAAYLAKKAHEAKAMFVPETVMGGT